jgi:hypothetical protein
MRLRAYPLSQDNLIYSGATIRPLRGLRRVGVASGRALNLSRRALNLSRLDLAPRDLRRAVNLSRVAAAAAAGSVGSRREPESGRRVAAAAPAQTSRLS